MQLTITNGTLTQVQETLTAASGYVLPSSVTVTGASSSYDSTSGSLTLSNITKNISITASGEEGQPTPPEPTPVSTNTLTFNNGTVTVNGNSITSSYGLINGDEITVSITGSDPFIFAYDENNNEFSNNQYINNDTLVVISNDIQLSVFSSMGGGGDN